MEIDVWHAYMLIKLSPPSGKQTIVTPKSVSYLCFDLIVSFLLLILYLICILWCFIKVETGTSLLFLSP